VTGASEPQPQPQPQPQPLPQREHPASDGATPRSPFVTWPRPPGIVERVLQPIPLRAGVTLRLLRTDDAEQLAEAYSRNRRYLEPWEPARSEAFFTKTWQAAQIPSLLETVAAGTGLPLVLATDTQIIGRVTLAGITRGVLQSGGMGYWIDEAFAGHGIMSEAVAQVIRVATDDLRLHRIQAETLLHNQGSQKVLEHNGFERIGLAPKYIKIAGRWQDHILFQRILHDD